jgi:peroxiredoxin 2/4
MTVLVGRPTPDFTAPAVLGDGSIVDSLHFADEIKGKYALVFFYPLDFTFVCPSELIALDHRMADFKSRGIDVFAVSIDSQFTHNAWRNTAINDGGIGPVTYTMVADINHSICQDFGVEHPDDGVAFRGTFMIDKNGVVRSQIVNDLPIGRNIEEILRTFDAIEHFEQHGEVCPANWNKGKKAMNASPEGVASYLTEEAGSL